jgi:hypothetical protein
LNIPYFYFVVYCQFFLFENNPFALLIDVMNKQHQQVISFTPTLPCKTKKELFMSNSHNKQAFINMLCEKLNEHDIRYKNAVDDAGLLIQVLFIKSF